MNRRWMVLIPLALTFALSLPPTAAAAISDEYLVSLDGTASRAELVQAIEAAGGKLLRDHSVIGLMIATSDDPDFAANLNGKRGVESVAADVKVEIRGAHPRAAATLPVGPVPGDAVGAKRLGEGRPVGRATVTDPTAAFFYEPLGWNYRAMHSAEAWALGHLGDPEVTVAVLDTGIDYRHIDVESKVDLAKSRSFVPEDDVLVEANYPGEHPVADLNFHGTLAAGVVAGNALGTTSTAPNVTLIGVKVINKDYASSVGRLASGIIHAADVDADVINISYAFWPNLKLNTPQGFLAWLTLRSAILYAKFQGSLVVAEASVNQIPPFTEGEDADRNGFDVILPAEAGAHIVVSGTDINDEFGNFNHFGNSLVDISAPGGQFPFVEAEITAVWGPCSSFTLIEAIDFCVLDAPFWVSVAGTIPATSEVSALAALIKSQHPDWTATQIRRQIYNTADDLGAPGKDEFFGRGRINLFRALTE